MNLRPSGYEPDELPGCSIPRFFVCPIAYRLFADRFLSSGPVGFLDVSPIYSLLRFWVIFWYRFRDFVGFLLGLAVPYSPTP